MYSAIFTTPTGLEQAMRRGIVALVGTGMLLTTATAAWGASGSSAPDIAEDAHSAAFERVVIRDVEGDRIGTVLMRQNGDFVQVLATSRTVVPGFHGFHVHETGLCDPDAAGGPFTTAGGHYTGGDTTHGDHAGDMPSLLVTESGRARLAFPTDRFTLAELRAGDGAAVMVHAGRDNFANIPERYSAGGVAGPDATTLATGDAGSRIGCGVID